MNQSKEERVHHVFEKIYKRYDMMNSVISFRRHRAWRSATMKRMDVQKNAEALDVCCGTGDWTIALAEQVGSAGKVVGLDFSQNMLKIAEQKVSEQRLAQVELLCGNAMELPFENDRFDYVTIGFGLRNVPDYLTVLTEMFRVVKPGGMVACLETSQPTSPLFRKAYYFYFERIMPFFGKLFAKSYNEYAWLHESAKSFPDQKELAQMFKNVGFEKVEVQSYTGGVAAMHLAHKPKKNA